MASAIEFADSKSIDINHCLHYLARSSYSKLEYLVVDFLPKLSIHVPKKRGGFDGFHYQGTRPWAEQPLGNQSHADVAVVIVGGGISGKFEAFQYA